jgi:tRNA threonylcarbamoyl adenosine modification protein YeaZ
MNLLAIDTAGSNFSLALYQNAEMLEIYISPHANNQAEMLVPEIEALLARHNFGYADLDFFAANVGPGSFTGLRIGLSVVKAWGLVLPAKAIAVTSLEAVAMLKGGGEVVLDARRGQAFQQKFDANLQALSEAELIDYVGEFANKFDAPANADWVAKAALHKLATGADLGVIRPLYSREADAKKSV